MAEKLSGNFASSVGVGKIEFNPHIGVSKDLAEKEFNRFVDAVRELTLNRQIAEDIIRRDVQENVKYSTNSLLQPLKKYYMVSVDGTNAPAKVWDNYDDAKSEAMRLAQITPRAIVRLLQVHGLFTTKTEVQEYHPQNEQMVKEWIKKEKEELKGKN